MATAQSQPSLNLPDFRTHAVSSIDEYLRQRLMPAECAIPQIPGIEMFGISIPAGTVGGDHLSVTKPADKGQEQNEYVENGSIYTT